MTGKIVITAYTLENGNLHTDIDVDVENESALEVVAVISNLARSLQFPLDLLPAALMMFNKMDIGSEHILIDRTQLEKVIGNAEEDR